MKKNVYSIDLAKIIAAFLIVAIHVRPFKTINPNIDFVVVNVLARLAVPFFFVAAGYFLSNKIENDWNGVKKYIIRLLAMYLIWTVIYLPLILRNHKIDSLEKLQEKAVALIQRLVFLGSFTQLWYLPALIFAVFFIYLCLKILSRRTLFVVSVVLFLIGLLGDGYYGLIKDNFFLNKMMDYYLAIFLRTRNGLFLATVFVMLGILIKQGKLLSKKTGLGGFLIFFALMFVEAFALRNFKIAKDYNMYLTLLPATYCLFCFIVQVELPDNKIWRWCRDTSTLVFLSHMLVVPLLKPIIANSLLLYGATILFTLTFAIIVIALGRVKGFRWLKVLW